MICSYQLFTIRNNRELWLLSTITATLILSFILTSNLCSSTFNTLLKAFENRTGTVRCFAQYSTSILFYFGIIYPLTILDNDILSVYWWIFIYLKWEQYSSSVSFINSEWNTWGKFTNEASLTSISDILSILSRIPTIIILFGPLMLATYTNKYSLSSRYKIIDHIHLQNFTKLQPLGLFGPQ